MSLKEEFREIVFNNRLVLVSPSGVIRYPERVYTHVVGGRYYLKTKPSTDLKQTSAGYRKRYLGVNVKNLDTGGQKTLLIHRAVAMAFIPNPEKHDQVHHINGNQRDNRVENLEWTDNHTNSQEYTNRRPKKGFRKFVNKSGNVYFASRMNIYGEAHNLGYFKTKKEAQQCYHDTYREWWGIEPYLEPRLIP